MSLRGPPSLSRTTANLSTETSLPLEQFRVRMGRRWRVVLATLRVEAVAAVAVLVYGGLSPVAVAVVYWVDLALVIRRNAVATDNYEL